MNFSGISARRRIAGACAASLLGGLAAATIAAPSAAAAPEQCSASAVSGTVSSVTGSARAYLDSHPGANQAVTTAFNQPRGAGGRHAARLLHRQSAGVLRAAGILAPIGDVQSQCNVTVLSPDLASAYSEFMAG